MIKRRELIINFYYRYDAGQWEYKQRVRDKMEQHHVCKIPRYSQIEVNGKIHTFTMRDYSHPELDKIDKQLAQIYQEYPYALSLLFYYYLCFGFDLITRNNTSFQGDTSCVFRNMIEEEKKEDLSVHCEKLAIAYL